MEQVSVLSELGRSTPQTLRKLETLTPLQAHLFLQQIKSEIVQQAAVDGQFWLRWVQTRDEADPEHSVKAYPRQMDYLNQLWDIFEREQCTVIAKSRQMMVSWAAAAYCVWRARSKPHQAIFWQTQKWQDATAMVCVAEGGFTGRCQFIERHLPAWMQQDAKEQEGSITYPNGSIIQALAGGADQVRGKVASLIIEDEFAKQEEAEGVWTTIAPLVQKGCKVIIISTPNGISNQFSTIYHGRRMDVVTA